MTDDELSLKHLGGSVKGRLAMAFHERPWTIAKACGLDAATRRWSGSRNGGDILRRAFTLIELLVVVAIISLLLGILLPVTGRARVQAKLLAVNAELRDISLALETYSLDHDGRYPPTRVDCMVGEHFYQLPPELAEGGYLPAASAGSFMAAGVEDRFNRGFTYKYRSVGTLIYNRTTVVEEGAYLWVPDGFPANEQEGGETYSDVKTSPVSWVLYSEGPAFDDARMRAMRYPVPRASWFDGQRGDGVITRLRLRNGNQVGSFER